MKTPCPSPLPLSLLTIFALASGCSSQAAEGEDDRDPTEKGDDPAATETSYQLRVLEIRYFPHDENLSLHHPDDLSAELQELLREGSRYRAYLDPQAEPSLEVEIVGVIDRHEARPNQDGSWVTTYREILAKDDLCARIVDDEIDQVWLWVDPRPEFDPNPGMEYVISSARYKGAQFATVAPQPFCEGARDFVIMGFDTTRPTEMALHSFGHFMEGVLGNAQSVPLFWHRFAGTEGGEFDRKSRCGNVHFPPNSSHEYEYDSDLVVETACQAWDPELTGDSITTDCKLWGCDGRGYLVWWMQSLPGRGNEIKFLNERLPNWWHFVADIDGSLDAYRFDLEVFFPDSFGAQ